MPEKKGHKGQKGQKISKGNDYLLLIFFKNQARADIFFKFLNVLLSGEKNS